MMRRRHGDDRLVRCATDDAHARDPFDHVGETRRGQHELIVRERALEELVDDSSYGDYRATELLLLSGCCQWTSEEHGAVSAWYMDFTNGRRGFVTRDYMEGGRVLCVREAPDLEEQEMGWR